MPAHIKAIPTPRVLGQGCVSPRPFPLLGPRVPTGGEAVHRARQRPLRGARPGCCWRGNQVRPPPCGAEAAVGGEEEGRGSGRGRGRGWPRERVDAPQEDPDRRWPWRAGQRMMGTISRAEQTRPGCSPGRRPAAYGQACMGRVAHISSPTRPLAWIVHTMVKTAHPISTGHVSTIGPDQ